MVGSQIQLLTVGDVALLFQFLQCLVHFGFGLVGGVLLKLLIGFISQQSSIFLVYSDQSITTVVLPLSTEIMTISLSLWSFLIADCTPGLRLLFRGLAVRRMALTFDLRCCADSSFSCRAVVSVEAIILRTRICCGVMTKLRPSVRTSSSLVGSVLLLILHTTCSVGIVRVSCLANRRENLWIYQSLVSLKLFSAAEEHQDSSFSHFPASTEARNISL